MTIFIRLLLLIFLLVVPWAAQAANDTHSCLTDLSGTLTDLDGDQGCNQYSNTGMGDGERIDARTAFWQMQTDPDIGCAISSQINTRISLETSTICWAGGIIDGTNDLDATWAEMHSPNTAAMISKEGKTIWDGVRIDNVGDGIRPWHRSSDGDGLREFEVRNVWMTYVRDNCVENDNFAPGLIDDSLFDGCYQFLSMRNPGADGVLADTVTIQNSLIRLEEQPGPNGTSHDAEGHAGLFKFENSSNGIVLTDNVFLVEACKVNPSTGKDCAHQSTLDDLGFQDSQTWTPSKLISCSGNVIVWLGGGDYPGTLPADEDCVTVTTDITVWNNARTRWINTHPRVERLSTDPVSTRPLYFRRR